MICLPAIAKREGCALLQPAPAPAPSDGGDDNESNGKGSSDANIDIKSLLSALGGFVMCENDDVMNTMMVTTSMMGPIYGVMKNNRDWLGEKYLLDKKALGSIYDSLSLRMLITLILSNYCAVKQGVSPRDASYFVGRSYLSMVQDAERGCEDPNRFDDLIEEQTPGGLNEQVRTSGVGFAASLVHLFLDPFRSCLMQVSLLPFL